MDSFRWYDTVYFIHSDRKNCVPYVLLTTTLRTAWQFVVFTLSVTTFYMDGVLVYGYKTELSSPDTPGVILRKTPEIVNMLDFVVALIPAGNYIYIFARVSGLYSLWRDMTVRRYILHQYYTLFLIKYNIMITY